ncbi:MAG: CoA transferase [Oscillospiraceae bacterium]|nr:CoA transferase [Oscillospiraceae bacterium]
MSDRNFIIPEFGPFAGMRVICSGSLIAMPFAATMLADFGAEVIHIERPGVGDTLRMLAPFAEVNGRKVSTAWAQDARNKLAMSLELNLKFDEVKEIFFGLLKEADVFMENMVWLDKLGIYDEDLLKVNPRLVIVHISGMGHKEFGGVPSICNRASYDMIGQAFSGWLNLQGEPNKDPSISKPYTNDFVSAFAALFGTLAGYTCAQRTGKGQVVDIAQFEAMAQYMCGTYTAYTMTGKVAQRTGNNNPAFQPYNMFRSSDGFLVALGAFGPGVFNRCIPAMGLDVEYFNYKDCSSGPAAVASPKGRELNDTVVAWCASHTAAQIESAMEGARVPCATVNTAKSAFENEHFKSRNDWISYEDQTVGAAVTAFGIAPKLSETPGQVWRGAPALGQDTDAILKTILGYDDAKIAELKAKKLI